LHHEIQLEAFHKIPAERRIIHVDATGGLVHITKAMKNYSQIMNYAIIVKDSLMLESPGLLLNETITSRQDTYLIGEFFRLVKFNLWQLYESEDKFGAIIICDLSWATIHAALEVFNLETINQYSKRIYNMIKDNKCSMNSHQIYIASCASHTMHRFVRLLKKKNIFNDKIAKKFAIYSFSLLLNCIDLEAFDKILLLIFIIHLTPSKNTEVEEAIDAIETLIENRPQLDDDIENIINTNVNLLKHHGKLLFFK
jgi:hypothetical protein